ncbi:MAG: SAF domain-containing protein [Chloroflexota bacterium]
MRPRTFALIILILLIAVVAVVFYLVLSGSLDIGGLLGGTEAPPTAVSDDGPDVAQPAATATPSVRYEEVVVTTIDVPLGQRIEDDFLEIELRPDTNIAVQAGYTFNDMEEVSGRIARVPIAEGQAVLNSMIALSPTDLASMGSDLSLYVEQGNVAIAMPIDRYSGAAYAMRPGDLVDVMMSLSVINVDPAFQTARPNLMYRVDPFALQEGNSFLFEPQAEGRLELIPGVNLVASIQPSEEGAPGLEDLEQIPRRVTQLTIQQAEVVWVGTWDESDIIADLSLEEQGQTQPQPPVAGEGEQPAVSPTETPEFARTELQPDLIILSMTPQDALSLKWAMDRGIDIDLALRSQGDTAVFATTSISLPQLVDQGGLTIPDRGENDLHPRADDVDPPAVEPVPPGQ